MATGAPTGSRIQGPVKHSRAKGDRRWDSDRPVGIEPTIIEVMWDWINPSEYDSTNDWTETKDTNAAVAVAADVDGGALALTSEATTDDDGALIQTVQASYSLTAGKKLWLKARVKVADADQQDAFIGLATDASITNPEDVLTQNDMCGFLLTDGDATISIKTEKDGTATSTATNTDLSDDTYVTLALRWDGEGKVEYFIDDARAGEITTNVPDDVQMCATLFSLSGDANGTKALTCDYLYIAQER